MSGQNLQKLDLKDRSMLRSLADFLVGAPHESKSLIRIAMKGFGSNSYKKCVEIIQDNLPKKEDITRQDVIDLAEILYKKEEKSYEHFIGYTLARTARIDPTVMFDISEDSSWMDKVVDEKNIDALVNDCLSFVDKRGNIIKKNSTGVSSSLEMKYEMGDLAFYFSVYCHCMGNGSCYLQVKKSEDIVFEATGCFTAKAYKTKAKIYKPGDWKKIIPYIEPN